jgi:hypothetical protein
MMLMFGVGLSPDYCISLSHFLLLYGLMMSDAVSYAVLSFLSVQDHQ